MTKGFALVTVTPPAVNKIISTWDKMIKLGGQIRRIA